MRAREGKAAASERLEAATRARGLGRRRDREAEGGDEGERQRARGRERERVEVVDGGRGASRGIERALASACGWLRWLRKGEAR